MKPIRIARMKLQIGVRQRRLTIEKLQVAKEFVELVLSLADEEASVEIVGGLKKRGWTEHDIDLILHSPKYLPLKTVLPSHICGFPVAYLRNTKHGIKPTIGTELRLNKFLRENQT